MFLLIRTLNSLSIASEHYCDIQASLKLLSKSISCKILDGVEKRGFSEKKVERQNARFSSVLSMLNSVSDLASIETYLDNPS